MEGSYPICYLGKAVGQVNVTRKGLYYHFECKCKYSEDVICRLTVSCGESEINLGVMVPEESDFVLNKRIPVKEFSTERPEFYIGSKEKPKNERLFVEICPTEPFSYIERLKDSFLTYQKGKPGIWISDKK